MKIDRYALVFAKSHIKTSKKYKPGSKEKKYHINKSMQLTQKIFCEPETINIKGVPTNVIVNTVTGDYVDISF